MVTHKYYWLSSFFFVLIFFLFWLNIVMCSFFLFTDSFFYLINYAIYLLLYFAGHSSSYLAPEVVFFNYFYNFDAFLIYNSFLISLRCLLMFFCGLLSSLKTVILNFSVIFRFPFGEQQLMRKLLQYFGGDIFPFFLMYLIILHWCFPFDGILTFYRLYGLILVERELHFKWYKDTWSGIVCQFQFQWGCSSLAPMQSH